MAKFSILTVLFILQQDGARCYGSPSDDGHRGMRGSFQSSGGSRSDALSSSSTSHGEMEKDPSPALDHLRPTPSPTLEKTSTRSATMNAA